MPRLAKQLIIGGIYLGVILLIVWSLYRITVPAPSCTDGVQNGGEEGVDCGAVACGVLCAAPVIPLEVADVQLLPAGNSTDVLVHLENTNPLYGATRLDYTLVVTDASGGELASRRGSTYVNPAQPRYLLFPLVGVSGTPAKAELQFDQAQVQWSALTVDAKGDIQFGVRDESLTTASGSIRFAATVLNRSKFDFDTVDVTVLLLDADGEVVSANTTVQRTLVAGEDRAFVMDWPFPVSGAVRAQTIVTTNVFENSNFIRAYGSQERFQGF